MAFSVLLIGCHRESYLYLGQTPPTDRPKVFAPGIVSLPNRNEEVITFSPDGQEIYFSSGAGEICRSQYHNGAYQPVEKLPSPINYLNQPNAACWGDAYVSPGEEFMIFRSNRPGGFGGSDLYITFRTEQNEWSNPMNLGSKINSPSDELGGDITPNGNYMTFGRDGDIYWVSTDFIDQKRKEGLD